MYIITSASIWVDMHKTKLMAILNATPDSFYESSRIPLLEKAIAAALQFQADGADILDIGGESSRPEPPS